MLSVGPRPVLPEKAPRMTGVKADRSNRGETVSSPAGPAAEVAIVCATARSLCQDPLAAAAGGLPARQP